MDPFSLATGIGGLISLTIDIYDLTKNYVGDVTSASKDIADLQLKLRALEEALRQFKDFLESDQAENMEFATDSGLELVRKFCQTSLEGVKKKLKSKKFNPATNTGASNPPATTSCDQQKISWHQRLTW